MKDSFRSLAMLGSEDTIPCADVQGRPHSGFGLGATAAIDELHLTCIAYPQRERGEAKFLKTGYSDSNLALLKG